jgi:hypothetical protein
VTSNLRLPESKRRAVVSKRRCTDVGSGGSVPGHGARR